MKQSIVDNCFKVLHGRDWIGVKVRTDTHAIVRKEISTRKISHSESEALLNPETVKCVGYIAQFCPNLNQCLVIFDNSELQPKWLACEKGQIEVIPERIVFPQEIPVPSRKIEVAEKEIIVGSEEREDDEREVSEVSRAPAPPLQAPCNGRCLLCNRIPVPLDLVFKCYDCKAICHETCAPPQDFLPLNSDLASSKAAKLPFRWKCWNCKGDLSIPRT